MSAAEASALGFPGMMGGLAKAPFDTLGDTLRGTQGIMMDMFQRPEKLHDAMERIMPLTIYCGDILGGDAAERPSS